MHGAGGNETTYLGSSERPTELKNILDQMIARQDIKPTIVVCPALNRQGSLFDNDEDGFCEEWRQSIVPAVEGHYHTYAETTDSEGLRASREHRMFGGFSAGSTTTWYAFLYDLDYIGYFLNMSSDCWVLGMEGGRDHPEETAEYLSNAARESGYGTNDYYIFAATGTDDHAYENLNNQIAAMAEKTDVFHYSDNGFTVGNLTYYTVEGNKHDYPYTYEYLYNGLRSFASVMSDDFYVASESSGLVSTNGDYPPLESVPSEYETSSEYGGTLQELSYVTKDYGGNGAVRETSAMVYLPYGYDSDDTDTKYNILYLMHGAYGNQYTYLGTERSATRLKNILDHMIENGDLEPVIVVAPHIPAGSDFYESTNANFYQELENDLMPAVESIYIFKDFSTGLYQITIGCNDPIGQQLPDGEIRWVNSIKLLYKCDYSIVINDAENILRIYDTEGRIALSNNNSCDVRIDYAPNIQLTEEETKQAFVFRDGQMYMVIGNGHTYLDTVHFDEGWTPPTNA